MRRTSYRRRGVVNVWVVLTLFMMVGLVGLAVDAGWSVLVLSQLQSAADSAALAGAALVKVDQDDARQAAHDLALANTAANITVKLDLNTANNGSGDIVLGRWDRNAHTFTATTTGPNAVKVVANRTSTGIDGQVPLIFGPSFGANTVGLSRSAIAMIQGATGAGMLVLDPTGACALNVGGTGNLTVNNGTIQVNSNNSCAVCNNGNPSISASTLNITGGNCLSNGILNGTANTGVPPILDPLAGLPAPPDGPTRPAVPPNGNSNLQPGFYPGGIRKNTGTTTMAPGVYVVMGNGFDISGNTTLIGNGVMIYIKAGRLWLNGTGNITLSPPSSDHPFTGWETYEHVTFFQSRTNFTQALINGTNSLNLTGTLYFPNNEVRISGTGLGGGNQLIAHRVVVWGTGDIVITYDGSFSVAAVGGTVFLVE